MLARAGTQQRQGDAGNSKDTSNGWEAGSSSTQQKQGCYQKYRRDASYSRNVSISRESETLGKVSNRAKGKVQNEGLQITTVGTIVVAGTSKKHQEN